MQIGHVAAEQGRRRRIQGQLQRQSRVLQARHRTRPCSDVEALCYQAQFQPGPAGDVQDGTNRGRRSREVAGEGRGRHEAGCCGERPRHMPGAGGSFDQPGQVRTMPLDVAVQRPVGQDAAQMPASASKIALAIDAEIKAGLARQIGWPD
jgi:hypothetical protein